MKLGPHINDFGRLDVNALMRMAPPILKSLQAHPHIREYKDQVAGLVIARSYVPEIDRAIANGDPSTLAAQMRDRLLSEWAQLLGVVDYFELVNETAQTGDKLKRLTDFTCEALRLMHAEGHKVAVGSFSVGNPNLIGDWYIFEPAVRAADAVALHEYGAPNVWSQPGVADPPNAGDPLASDLGWWTLRYRRVRDQLNEIYHSDIFRMPPFIITELGVDVGELGQGRGGWRKAGLTPAEYVHQLAWYNAEMSYDDYVLGATVFCYGGTPDWEGYDLVGVKPFEDYVRGGCP